MSWMTVQADDADSPDWHVIPIKDLREHACRSDCWCAPTRDQEEPVVVIHNSLDAREFTKEMGKIQ